MRTFDSFQKLSKVTPTAIPVDEFGIERFRLPQPPFPSKAKRRRWLPMVLICSAAVMVLLCVRFAGFTHLFPFGPTLLP